MRLLIGRVEVQVARDGDRARGARVAELVRARLVAALGGAPGALRGAAGPDVATAPPAGAPSARARGAHDA